MKKGFKPPEGEDHGDKALWDLLGRARKTQASPYFARKVIRAINDPVPSPLTLWPLTLWNWLRRPAVVSFAMAAAVALLALLLFKQRTGSADSLAGTGAPRETPLERMAESQKSAPEGLDFTEELESIDRFGQLMAVTDPGELSDEALRDLLF